MKKIAKLTEQIDEELEGAKHYTEMYLDFKADNQNEFANKFKEAAMDELKHANYLHEYAVQVINKYKEKFTPPQNMQDEWDKSHALYIEKAAWIKTMLAM